MKNSLNNTNTLENKLSPTEILGKATYDAKQLRISMGAAFVNNTGKINFLSLKDEGMSSILKIKNQAIQRLNQLENMINNRINQGVATILQNRPTIQKNPFFKKKTPFKGLNDLENTMKRVNDNGRIEQILDVMKRDNLIKSKSNVNRQLQNYRNTNMQKKKQDKILENIKESKKIRAKTSKKSKKYKGKRFNENPHNGIISQSQYSRNPNNINSSRNCEFRINGRIIKKKVSRAKVIPRDIRKGNPFADLPVIKDEDLKEGIYNLVSQGFIPKEVDVEPILGRESGILNITKARTGVLDKNLDHKMKTKNPPMMSFIDNYSLHSSSNMNNSIKKFNDSDMLMNSNYLTEPNNPIPRMRTTNYSQKSQKKSNNGDPMREAIDPQEFIKDQILRETIEIEDGRVKERDPNFIKFKGKYFYMWGDVREILDKLRVHLESMGIMNVQVVTSKVIRISSLMREPTKSELTDCVDNFQMVLEASKTKKRDRIKKNSLQEKAAKIIQKAYKNMKSAMVYLKKLLDTKKKLARIQQVVKIWYRYRKTKKLIRRIKEDMCNEYIDMNQNFMNNWGKIKNDVRVEIHMNSLGYDRFQKLTMANFRSSQNSQLSRIFRLIDPNVEIVYVTPFDIKLEVLSYYVKILDILGVPNVSERIHLITPENSSFFEKNYLSVTNLLYYSPKACRKIISIVGEKTSYIVGGYPSFDDVKLALKLNCPFLTGNPFINKK